MPDMAVDILQSEEFLKKISFPAKGGTLSCTIQANQGYQIFEED
jgi:hypothetical protein